MSYQCPQCREELKAKHNKYKCINSNCELKDSKIIVEEGYHDILVIDKDTQEIKTESRWCITYDIKHE